MTRQRAIAIVGMGGIFPEAPDLRTFWKNIVEGKDTAKEVPSDRWVMPAEIAYSAKLLPDRTYSKRACFVDEIPLNAEEMNLSKELFELLDPLHEMALYAGWKAWRSAKMAHVDKKRIGVILAAIALPSESASRLAEELFLPLLEDRILGEAQTSPHLATADVTAFPAALLAKSLGLGGGSYTLDAACASSLYALKLACDALEEGRLDAVLAGGVSRPDNLYTQIGFSQLKALSPSGHCAPFDREADGLVVGEGAGVVILKRLEDALEAGDEILGIIEGIGLSNDIGGSLLAPDTEGQLRAMRAAYEEANWHPEEVDLIECHGTGTPLGDLKEGESLCQLWGVDELSPDSFERRCAIGSIKSMIGHLLTAASVAGLIKILLAFRHQILPPSANFNDFSPKNPLKKSPFFVPTQPQQWPRRAPHKPRKAALSAFGFGGINGHLLLSEWDPEIHHLASRRIHPIHSQEPIAIVGMAAHIGPIDTIERLTPLLFQGKSLKIQRPPSRHFGLERYLSEYLQGSDEGIYIDHLSIPIGKFRIPPQEIQDILPQQLLMLDVAAKALEDAKMPLRERRPKMGAFIGMTFDYGATHFHLRWSLYKRVEEWSERLGLNLNEEELRSWAEELADSLGKPLNAPRTVGALGGIVASRIAKEFLFGGSSFVLSGEEHSGLRAIELAMDALRRGELDHALVGAVDLGGDIREFLQKSFWKSYSDDACRPFEEAPQGAMVGEGAIAFVLKRLSDAEKSGDRIISIIRGAGFASGGGFEEPFPTVEAQKLALQRAYQQVPFTSEAISYIETHANGQKEIDKNETKALLDYFDPREEKRAIGMATPYFGQMGALGGLASLLKMVLALYHRRLPALPHFERPASSLWKQNQFYFPKFSHYWWRNRVEGPRRGAVHTLSFDGNVSHLLLEEPPKNHHFPQTIERDPRSLFVIEADDVAGLQKGLKELQEFLHSERTSGPSRDELAARWLEKHPLNVERKKALALLISDLEEAHQTILWTQKNLQEAPLRSLNGERGCFYAAEPLGREGRTAFVYPGSGNHFVGLGREVALRWPAILDAMDEQTDYLEKQMLPDVYVPFRTDWSQGWEREAARELAKDTHNMIFGQVVYGGVMTEVVKQFGLRADAVIGYSLGESAGLFAWKAWPDRGAMLKRMQHSELFRTELAGECTAARQVWQIPPNEKVDWRVALVRREAQEVQKALNDYQTLFLLIVNTPDECVIGGRKKEMDHLLKRQGWEVIYLEGVVTVHCEAVEPVAQAYRDLHLFPTTPPKGIDFYSVAWGDKYSLTSEKAADSILAQARHGFDFTKTIEKAYQDGIRLFLEMGPQASTARMIDKILNVRPHLALSFSSRNEGDSLATLKALAQLITHRIPLQLEPLFAHLRQQRRTSPSPTSWPQMTISLGNIIVLPSLLPIRIPIQPLLNVVREPLIEEHLSSQPSFEERDSPQRPSSIESKNEEISPIHSSEFWEEMKFVAEERDFSSDDAWEQWKEEREEAMSHEWNWNDETMMKMFVESTEAKAEAHQAFLEFSQHSQAMYAELTRSFHQLFAQLLASSPPSLPSTRSESNSSSLPATRSESKEKASLWSKIEKARQQPVVFDREMCMEFAVGSLAKVFGPEFAIVDTYPVRVRLPDEPLMLVDRIIAIEGEKGSLTSGRIITEHDVEPDAWYLDNGCMPVCMAVEAGQADLFLSSYLGIDLAVKGKRSYRLLDAEIHFHRHLPREGEVIRYDIHIDKFVKQGDIYLFFFRFEGTIDGEPLLTMQNGCAGFFTPDEVKNSGGLILTEESRRPQKGRIVGEYRPLVPVEFESYDDEQVWALREGDLATCFGEFFEDLPLENPVHLPKGRMELFHRVHTLDPRGGRFGLGQIRAEADIHPDDWFLTSHFVDDMVMPGTLMYECCAHTLRVLLMRMGWIGEHDEVAYEPVPEIHTMLRCRGPVLPETQKVGYEVEIKEIGYRPEPYVIADAVMFADGQPIVSFENMSMQLSNSDKATLENFWQKQLVKKRQKVPSLGSDELIQTQSSFFTPQKALYDREKILAYAEGKPSEAFGEPYRIFDEDRILARLPRPPYLFLDRITAIDHEQWSLAPGGWIEAEYDIPADAWYFRANRQGSMPFAVLLEVALQPCGWLAAYAGSALHSSEDLSFRNLGGKATLYREVTPSTKMLRTSVRMKDVSKAGGMIIEKFDMKVRDEKGILYEGDTYFGFFSKRALAEQVGIIDAPERAFSPTEEEWKEVQWHTLPKVAPLIPDDPNFEGECLNCLPAGALLMVDEVAFLPKVGPNRVDFIRGHKKVDPHEWFFRAHFYQDPVCPGSLGLESFLQLLKFYAIERWGEAFLAERRFQSIATEIPHEWIYRGQILPTAKEIEIDAVITKVTEGEEPVIYADGFLKVNGLFIYEMLDFAIRLVRISKR